MIGVFPLWMMEKLSKNTEIRTALDILKPLQFSHPKTGFEIRPHNIKKLEANQYRKLSYEDGFQNLSLDEKIAVVSKLFIIFYKHILSASKSSGQYQR